MVYDEITFVDGKNGTLITAASLNALKNGIWDGARRGLVTVPKNTTQPSFDNASLLQQIMRDRKAAGGGAILMPEGSTFVGSQILIPSGVYLWNPDPKAGEVKARTDFPINTPVVRIGDYPIDSDVVFQCGLWGVSVHANDITGGTCVYSSQINEGSGIYHAGMFGFKNYGIEIAGPTAQNFEIHELECYQSSGVTHNGAIYVHGVGGANKISKVTCGNAVGAGDAIKITGSYISISDIHVEGSANGLNLSGAGLVQNIVGNPLCTNLVHIQNDSLGWTCQWLFAAGATNTLVDDFWGLTIPGTENSGIVEIYVQQAMGIGKTHMYSDAAAPTLGTHRRGEIVWNNAPSASGKIGWTCVTAGTPGTWKAFGPIDA